MNSLSIPIVKLDCAISIEEHKIIKQQNSHLIKKDILDNSANMADIMTVCDE